MAKTVIPLVLPVSSIPGIQFSSSHLLTKNLVAAYPGSCKLIVLYTRGIRSVPHDYSLVLENTRSLLDYYIGLTMRVIRVHVVGEVEGYDYKVVILSRRNMRRQIV